MKKFFRRTFLTIVFITILSGTRLGVITDELPLVQSAPQNNQPFSAEATGTQFPPQATPAPESGQPSPAQQDTSQPGTTQTEAPQTETAQPEAPQTETPQTETPQPDTAPPEATQTPGSAEATAAPTDSPAPHQSAPPEEPLADEGNESEPAAATPEPTPIVMPAGVINPYRSTYPSPYIDGQLTEERESWSYRRNSSFQPPEGFFKHDIRLFGGDYLGDISRQVVYLTIDLGYDTGYTSTILDILKEKNVKASFFLTRHFIESCPDLTKRMKNEGHIVGNHSSTHPEMSKLTNDEVFAELREVETIYKATTGYDLDPYFRFPEGVYNMRVLEAVHSKGYKTFFWSLAYMDWDPDKQPGRAEAFRQVTSHIHNGSVILLHAEQSNTEALGDIIDHVRALGYAFETLADIR